MNPPPFTYYEFFAGGGMARSGLGEGWRCLFANDFDAHKAESYRANWGGDHLTVGDVWDIGPEQLPGRADLAWASSPCQDVSLAGRRAGLSGARSSAFWGFWRLVESLERQGRGPRLIVLENVVGLLNSRGGADFTALCETVARQGWRFGAVEVDAALFTPQSRPRMFLVLTRDTPPAHLTQARPAAPFHGRRVVEAHARLPQAARTSWLWWRLAAPPSRNEDLAALLEPDGAVAWHTKAETDRLVALLGPVHRAKLAAATAAGERRVGAVFRRIRSEHGQACQRAEVRFDGLAGCLRTPRGGSSRQFLMVVDGPRVRTRALSPREGARLMGLPDNYRLPQRATAAFHLIGDGVAAPVVRHLAEQLLEPMLAPRAVLAAE
ncbi:MAG TPA: DNA cytosine methyltransferase [Caulobacteraceae bacterium]|jgi:DNA (cytosine-5)-methyltransferase 1|nr:DNA cytosine methyltransferase [Caulobacteraceae bacterium]